MLFLALAVVTLLYLLFWPFTLWIDARLSPTSGRAEVTVASLFRLRLEGDFLQPPWLCLWRLDERGVRRPLGRKRMERGGFRPVIRDRRFRAALYVGAAGDGALTVEALGLLYALLEVLGTAYGAEVSIRPTPCFDKTICAMRFSGIGRLILAQNILEYLKGTRKHADR